MVSSLQENHQPMTAVQKQTKKFFPTRKKPRGSSWKVLWFKKKNKKYKKPTQNQRQM